MFRTWFSLLSAGCVSSFACAQAVVTIESEKYELLPGESTEVTVRAAFPRSEFAFAAVITDLLSSSGAVGWSDLEVPKTLWAPGFSVGTPTGMGIEDIIAAQAYYPPAGLWPDLSNPILFWKGTYTAPSDAEAPFDLSLRTQTSRFDTYFSISEFGTRSHLDGLIEGEATIHVVPAPASLALVLLCGALANRRRW